MNSDQIISALAKSENPSVRYRLITEILDTAPGKDDLFKLTEEIATSKPVTILFDKMHSNGYWLQTDRRTKKTVGDGVEYGAYASTHYILSYLSELGLDKTHPLIEKAANRYLNLQVDGDWWNHMSCLNGLNIRTFIRLGYRHDERLQKVIDLMLVTERKDGGYLCDMHEKRSKKKKSCYRGALKMLLAYSEMPEYWQHPRCKALINYFLDRNGIYTSSKTDFVNNDINLFSFPVSWGSNTWEVLYALSKMGFGNDERLKEAWKLADSKRNDDGFYRLDHTPEQIPIKFGKKGNASEWITFYMVLALKYKP